MGSELEQTVFICREVSCFRIPPRLAAGGHKSGDWKVADKIFTGRLRVVAKGADCEIRLEESNSGELFATVPVPSGQKNIAVEAAADSSRYFVLRAVNPSTGQHAFLGMGFNDRGEAFDFNVALSDHEKHLRREQEAQAAASDQGRSVSHEVELLHKKQDLSLKEGQTIKINMSKPAAKSGGFLSSLGSKAQASSGLIAPPKAPPQPFQSSGGLSGSTTGQKPPSGAPTSNWATFE